MRMKGDILALGCHEPQAQLFSTPPYEGEQILCDLASESGVRVLRKGNLDLTEQNSSTGAVHHPSRNPHHPSRKPHQLQHGHPKL